MKTFENSSVSTLLLMVWLGIFMAVFVWSAIAPKDMLTWFLEVVPAMIAVVLLALTFQRFPLTALVYWLILVHCIILMIGGHFTYAEVPLFDKLGSLLGSGRNDYDKVGHFAQGFIPVLIAREILIRRQIVNGAVWTNIIAVVFCLAFSGFYELIEWGVAEMSGESAEAFLGTQGYVWDTQSDMACALLGAILSVILLSRYHNGQISRLSGTRP